jgi:hypothetical protein
MHSAPEKFISSAASQLPRAGLAAFILLGRRVGSFISAFAAPFGARCAINHLRSLDDDRLRDLGLERKDIERFVRFGRD